jgi:mRNA-degrading endonuclease RelE of RelBE toxin-antitoxin system
MATLLHTACAAFMSSRPSWNDWITPSFYRIRVSMAAAEKLRRLPDDVQHRLKDMLEDIAEIAASTPAGLAHAWNTSFNRPLLQLRLGRTTLRYAIDEDTRTISVEHVVVPDEGADREGGPPVGKVG